MAAAGDGRGQVPRSRVFRQPGHGWHRGEGEHRRLQRGRQDHPCAGGWNLGARRADRRRVLPGGPGGNPLLLLHQHPSGGWAEALGLLFRLPARHR